MTKLICVSMILLILSGCTDAVQAKLGAFGNAGTIKCYSGNMVIYEGKSTGKISNSEQSDGYYFMEKGTNTLVEILEVLVKKGAISVPQFDWEVDL